MQAMLRRSRAVYRYIDAPVDFLTYGFQENMSVAEDSLRKRGHLTSEINVRNMWDILAMVADEFPLENVSKQKDREILPEFAGVQAVSSVTDTGLQRVDCYSEKSRRSEINYIREDGSRFVCDMLKSPNARSSRRVVLLDRDQTVLKSWPTKTDVFAWILTQVLGHEPSVIIVDNPAIANSIARNDYVTPSSVMIKYYHSSHTDILRKHPFGVMREKHKIALDKADIFDANVFPTTVQTSAASTLVGSTPDMTTVGNVVEPPSDILPESDRQLATSVVISRLVKSKNVDHAVQALVKANDSSNDGAELTTLKIFGRGETYSELERLIEESGSNSQVRLLGYSTDVYSEFQRASFSILPTGQEAFGLSLVESMACGCIPIAYDVPYGPGAIITDGVDGFLVPFGDIDGLAERVIQLREMGYSELESMRSAARKRAEDFDSDRIGKDWCEAVSAAWQRKTEHLPVILGVRGLRIERVTPGLSGLDRLFRITQRPKEKLELELAGDIFGRWQGEGEPRVFISLRGRKSNLRLRIPGTVHTNRRGVFSRKRNLRLRFSLSRQLLARAPRDTIDLYLRVNDGTNVREIKIPAKGVDMSQIFLPRGLEAYATVNGNLSFRRSGYAGDGDAV